MSNNTFNYFKLQERYHTFSKLPINDEMGLGNVVNKSGHTIIASDVWAEDIPWFVPCANQKVAITTYSSAQKADLITMRGKVYQRNSESISDTDFSGFGVNSPEVANEFARLWKAYNGTGVLNDNDIITNINDKPVLKYHKGAKIDLLTVDNNSIGSNNTAGRIWKDGQVVKQFVSINDKIVNGVGSNGYKPAIYSNGSSLGTEVATDEAEEGFYINSFGGVIFFLKDYSDTTLTANIFEYIGQTLETKIDELEENGGGSSVSEEQVKEWAEEIVTEKTLSGSIAEETTDNLVTDTQVKEYVTTKIGEIPATDLSDYYTKEEVDDALESKVDELTVDSKISTAIEDALGEGGSIKAELDTKADTSALENLASKDEVTNAINSALGEDGAISGAIDDVKTELSDKIDTAVDALAEGAVATNTAAIDTLNGDVTVDGSVAKTVADAIAGIDVGVTSVTVENANDNVQIAATTADGAVTLKVTTSDIASQSELTTLQTTVGDENSGLVKAVADNAAEIANKASQSDLNALEGEIAKKADSSEIKALSDKINAIKGFSIEKVNELPEASADCVGKIYLKSKTSVGTNDIHEEYICVETEVEGTKKYSWELIGSTEISLDGYVTDDDLTSALDSLATQVEKTYAKKDDIPTVSDFVTKTEVAQTYVTKTELETVDNRVDTLEERVDALTPSEDGEIGVQTIIAGNGISVSTTEDGATINTPKVSLKIGAKNADNYYGSSLLTVENNETVTIVANPTSTWEYDRTTNDFSKVTSVEDDMLFEYDSESDTNVHVASIDGKNLTSGEEMFRGCDAIESFISDMPKLKNGTHMFSDCTNLQVFQGELTRLSNGNGMFSGCTKLTSFCGDLGALIDGDGMFLGCNLDKESIEIICDTLPTLNSPQTNGGRITISGQTSDEIIEYILSAVNNKKWTIIYNGTDYSPTTQE